MLGRSGDGNVYGAIEQHTAEGVTRSRSAGMTRASDRANLRLLREAARATVKAAELTRLAEALTKPDFVARSSWMGGGGASGMSSAQLKEFLYGSGPSREPEAHTSAEPSFIGGEMVVIAALVRDLPPEGRRAAADGLVEVLGSVYRERGVPRPEWLAAELVGSCP